MSAVRVAMIHALGESVAPVKMAFQEEFPEAELVNVLDEGLFIDFDMHITPQLRRRMSQLICYCAEHGADAVALACSVYAPVVESARDLVDIPVLSSYDAVMDAAVACGTRIGIISSVPATVRDSEFYLRKAAEKRGKSVEPVPYLDVGMMQVLRTDGEPAFHRRLAEEAQRMAPDVDALLLSQFSMATALPYLRKVTPVPVLSAPHSAAHRLRELLG